MEKDIFRIRSLLSLYTIEAIKKIFLLREKTYNFFLEKMKKYLPNNYGCLCLHCFAQESFHIVLRIKTRRVARKI
jgi:hypothetical protein